MAPTKLAANRGQDLSTPPNIRNLPTFYTEKFNGFTKSSEGCMGHLAHKNVDHLKRDNCSASNTAHVASCANKRSAAVVVCSR